MALVARDPAMLVWWASEVEGASAIARLDREGALDPWAATQAFDRLKHLAAGGHEVDPSDAIREAAVRFLRVHTLRTADAPSAGRGLHRRETAPSSLEVVTLDITWPPPPARKASY
jgi:hypothetical protein